MLVPWIRATSVFWVLLALVVGCDTSGSQESSETEKPVETGGAAKQPPASATEEPEPPAQDGPVADMKKMVEEVCACKDQACVVDVQTRTAKLGEKYRDGTMNADQAKQLGDLARQFTKCAVEIGGPKDGGPAGDK